MTEPTQPGQPPVSWTPPPSQPSPRPGQGFNFNEFISFRYLITPALVTVIYVIGAVLITLGAVVAMASRGGDGFVGGLLLLFFGNLYWRVLLEFIMVLFRMNDSLQAIERRGRGL
jgi:hypothetical protein